MHRQPILTIMMKPIQSCPNCRSNRLLISGSRTLCEDCSFDLTAISRLKSEAFELVRMACEKRHSGALFEAALLARDALDIEIEAPEYRILLGILYQQLNMNERAEEILSPLDDNPDFSGLISLLLNKFPT